MSATPNKEFRQYDSLNIKNTIKNQYQKARQYQTYEFVQERIAEFNLRVKQKSTVWEAIELLEKFVDLSDPDISLPNLHHLLQTAEAIRQDGHPDWLQLVGLLHDLGKVLYLQDRPDLGMSKDEQWAIVGDTFIVGYPIPKQIVYPEFNQLNKDHFEGVNKYKEGCGLDNCLCSWGHDEYMYRVLSESETKLPDIALKIIRYHSLYLWHQEGQYNELMIKKTFMNDFETLKWVKIFNKYDLYSKKDIPYSSYQISSLREYYQSLIDKYLPNGLIL